MLCACAGKRDRDVLALVTWVNVALARGEQGSRCKMHYYCTRVHSIREVTESESMRHAHDPAERTEVAGDGGAGCPVSCVALSFYVYE